MKILTLSALFLLSAGAPDVESAASDIINAGKYLNLHKMCPATSGNISVRLSPDLIAITSSGKHKGDLIPADILLIDAEGRPLNDQLRPSAETAFHTLIYAMNANIGAVLHHHSVNATVLSRMLENETAVITEGYEIHKAFPGISTHHSRVVTPIFENSQDYKTLSEEISTYLKVHPDTFGFLLRGHGLYTWGKNMNEARIRAEAFELLFECEIKSKRN